MANKLTPKQERFVQGLFAMKSQRAAWKEAFPEDTSTDKSIDENASRLSKDVKITSRLAELENELALRNMVTIERVLVELAKIGFSDIKDFLSYKTERVQVDTDKLTGQPIFAYRQVIDTKDSDTVDGTLISEVSVDNEGKFKFKLHDKMAALDKLGKTLKMFTDKVEHSGEVQIKIKPPKFGAGDDFFE